MISSIGIDCILLCSLTLLEMTLHVNVYVWLPSMMFFFFLCLHVLSFLFSLFILTWFHLHYSGGVCECVCAKAICCCEEKLLPISINLSCCAVDPGKCFECHLLDKNYKCNLWEPRIGKGSSAFHFLLKIANTILTIFKGLDVIGFSAKNK